MSTGFFITNVTGKLRRLSDVVGKQVFKKLYIYVSVKEKQPNIKNHEWISKKITDMYISSFQLFPELDVRIILNDIKVIEERVPKIDEYNVDVIIIPKDYDQKQITTFRTNKKKLSILYVDDLVEDDISSNRSIFKMCNNVVLGGTFDRLHTGHKILLSEAILRCSKKLTVGVTDINMIKGKKLWELIEPCSKRIQEVEKFVKEVDASIECEVVPISDMFGPTKDDPHLNMIVVSSETLKGGFKVNELRKERGLNELEIHVVNLIEDSNRSNEEETKIGSSNIRMRLLGTRIRIPEMRPDLPKKPYIIGLTGGVAAGKTTIREYLTKLGAGTIDCDKIAHDLYLPGSDIYFKLISLFGETIIAQNGEINRSKLGGIVFKDVMKLEMLNDLMWPAILKEALRQCSKLYNEDKKEVVVLEAAVLLKAGWLDKVHEVWASIIPQSEAITRLKKRNSLSEEDAKIRTEVLPTNSEFVENCNVVFCTLWSYEFTWLQVEKAWNDLQRYISTL